MRILALDLATKTGWAVSDGPSGVETFAVRRGESPGMRFVRFRAWCGKVCETWRPGLVVYEQAHHRGGAPTEVAIGLVTSVQEICAERGIEHTSIHTSKIKQHATGKGNANKEAMVTAAEARWPSLTIIDDNHADALWLLDLAETTFTQGGP